MKSTSLELENQADPKSENQNTSQEFKNISRKNNFRLTLFIIIPIITIIGILLLIVYKIDSKFDSKLYSLSKQVNNDLFLMKTYLVEITGNPIVYTQNEKNRKRILAARIDSVANAINIKLNNMDNLVFPKLLPDIPFLYCVIIGAVLAFIFFYVYRIFNLYYNMDVKLLEATEKNQERVNNSLETEKLLKIEKIEFSYLMSLDNVDLNLPLNKSPLYLSCSITTPGVSETIFFIGRPEGDKIKFDVVKREKLLYELSKLK